MFGGETSVERLWLVVNDAAPPGKELKYARLERERRFLLRVSPAEGVVKTTRIADRYLLGTRLRLRRAIETVTVGGIGERTVYKLTQKVPAPDGGPGLITTLYLDAVEYAVLEQLPAATVHKTRLSVPPLGIDVFEDALAGLVLAEAEFDDDESLESFIPPREAVAEVTQDQRLTGGNLAVTTKAEIEAVLADYGLFDRAR